MKTNSRAICILHASFGTCPCRQAKQRTWVNYELITTQPWTSEGEGGARHPLDFKNFSKEGIFPNFHWEKINFTTFGPPGKILEKSLGATPWKKSFRRPCTQHQDSEPGSCAL